MRLLIKLLIRIFHQFFKALINFQFKHIFFVGRFLKYIGKIRYSNARPNYSSTRLLEKWLKNRIPGYSILDDGITTGYVSSFVCGVYKLFGCNQFWKGNKKFKPVLGLGHSTLSFVLILRLFLKWLCKLNSKPTCVNFLAFKGAISFGRVRRKSKD